MNFKSHGVTILLAPCFLSNVSLDLSVARRTASGGFNHEPHTLTQRRERDRQRGSKRERETHAPARAALGGFNHTQQGRETHREPGK